MRRLSLKEFTDLELDNLIVSLKSRIITAQKEKQRRYNLLQIDKILEPIKEIKTC